MELLKTLFGIGIAGSMLTLFGAFIKGIFSSGLFNPSTFPAVVSGTMTNLYSWGSSLGGVIIAMLGVLLIFVIMRIVVTLL